MESCWKRPMWRNCQWDWRKSILPLYFKPKGNSVYRWQRQTFTCLSDEREAQRIPMVSIFQPRIENKPQALKFQGFSLTLCPTSYVTMDIAPKASCRFCVYLYFYLQSIGRSFLWKCFWYSYHPGWENKGSDAAVMWRIVTFILHSIKGQWETLANLSLISVVKNKASRSPCAILDVGDTGWYPYSLLARLHGFVLCPVFAGWITR